MEGLVGWIDGWVWGYNIRVLLDLVIILKKVTKKPPLDKLELKNISK